MLSKTPIDMSVENKVGIIIQARMGSTRMPAKIMMQIKNKPIFQYQIDVLSKLTYPIYIATTTNPQDDAIVDFAKKNSLPYFRGSEENVLDRYYNCAKKYNLNTVVRLTSDCPLIDAYIIEEGISQFLKSNDSQMYLSNTLDRTYPRGDDFEVFSFLQLKDAYENAVESFDIEHVTPYIWKNKNGNINIIQLKQKNDCSLFRLTLDTQEDFNLIKILIEQYDAEKLNMKQICDIMRNNHHLLNINSHIEQKKV